MAIRGDANFGLRPEPWQVHTNVVEALVTAKVPEVLELRESDFRELVPWPAPGDQLLATPVGKKKQIEQLASCLEVTVHQSALNFLMTQHHQVRRGPHWVGNVGFDSVTEGFRYGQVHAKMSGFAAMAFPTAVRRGIITNLPANAKRIYFLGAIQGNKALAWDYHREAKGRVEFELRMHDLRPHRDSYIAKSEA